MQIKFIRPFRFIGNSPDDGSDDTVPVGCIVDLENDESTQWLIDNGFAERCEEQWPLNGDLYWFVDEIGSVVFDVGWTNPTDEFTQREIGNVFKTRESAQRFADYLKAVETVRHDEGFMKISRKVDYTPYGYAIAKSYWSKSLVAERVDSVNYAGKFYFDTSKHAQASLEAHSSEWKTIINYDWTKE